MSRSRYLFFIIILGFTPLSWAEVPQDLTRLLPANTQVVIDVRDMPGLLKKWDASPFYRFYNDPRAASFFRPLRAQVENFKQRFGIDSDRLWRFFNGELIVAGVATSANAKGALEWVVLARHNGDSTVLARFKRPPAPPGSSMRIIPDQYHGIGITRLEIVREVRAEVPLPGEQNKKKNKKNKNKKNKITPMLTAEDLGQGPIHPQAPAAVTKQIIENYEEYAGPDLIVHAGTHGRPLHRILDRLAEGDAKSTIAGQPEFVKVREAAGSDGDVTVYADAGALAASSLRGDSKASPLLNLGGMGLEEIKAAALNVNLQAGRVAVAGALLAPEPRLGVSRVLFLPDGPAPDVAGLVPPEAVSYSAASMPLPKLWGVALQTLQVVSPAAAVLLESQFMAFEQGTGLKVEQALAGHLGGQLARFVLPVKERGGEEPVVYLIGLRDGPAFRDGLKILLDYALRIGGYHLLVDKGGALAAVDHRRGSGRHVRGGQRQAALLPERDRPVAGGRRAARGSRSRSQATGQSARTFTQAEKVLPGLPWPIAGGSFCAGSGGCRRILSNRPDPIGGDGFFNGNERRQGRGERRRIRPESGPHARGKGLE